MSNTLDPNDDELITAYMNASLVAKKVPRRFEQLTYLSESGELIPASAFNERFGTPAKIEKEVFYTFFVYTEKMLQLEHSSSPNSSRESDEESLPAPDDAASYLLSFYYTLFEVFAANRDYIRLRFASPLTSIQSLMCLDQLKVAFCHFLKGLNQYDPLVPLPFIKQAQEKAFVEAGWLQFLSIFQFWLKDESVDNERTDALIEKSLILGLDVLQLQNAERHLADWAKFWLQK
jgi:hypothetical protein